MIVAAGDQIVTIFCELQHRDTVGVGKMRNFASARSVPQPYDFIPAGGSNILVIITKSDGSNGTEMLDRSNLLPGSNVPQANLRILRNGRQKMTIRAKRDL